MKRLLVTLAAALAALGTPTATHADDAPGTFKIPGTGTTVKFYGFIQLDGTYDLNGRTTDINGLDWASFLPVQPFDNSTPKQQLYLTGRTSRFGVTTNTATPIGAVGAKLEGDFNSPSPNNYSTQLTTNGVTFRLRHAYGTIGNFLVGQTWSTYMDLNSLPDTVDFNMVGGLNETRQPMIRYTIPLGGGSSLAFAVESSFSRQFTGLTPGFAGNNGQNDASALLPDVIANYTHGGGWGSVSARGVLLSYHSRLSDTVDHHKAAFGAGLSGSFKLGGDTLVWGAQGGKGIGRYMFNTLLQSAIDDGTDIRLWNAIGYHAGYTHLWNARFRSNVIVSQTFIGQDQNAANGQTLDEFARTNPVNPSGQVLQPNKRIDELAVNTFWTITNNVEVGLEYRYGKRVTFTPDEGTQHRINASFHLNLL